MHARFTMQYYAIKFNQTTNTNIHSQLTQVLQTRKSQFFKKDQLFVSFKAPDNTKKSVNKTNNDNLYVINSQFGNLGTIEGVISYKFNLVVLDVSVWERKRREREREREKKT